MTDIDESNNNIEFNVFNNGNYIRVEATFKDGDPYLFKCKGKSETLNGETILYKLFNWGDNFDRRFEICLAESILRLKNDFHTREGISNLNIKLTDKANENKKLSKYLLEWK